jgi:hypothetical protein
VTYYNTTNQKRYEWPDLGMARCHARWNISAAFHDWLLENESVWLRFESEALRIWNRGRDHYSARTIIEVLRHESCLSDTDQDYKLNNNAAPNLARLFMLVHPNCGEFFQLRGR